jgi:CheY-like chemotaxis protein/glycine cleavage system H lipoate-binding protein
MTKNKTKILVVDDEITVGQSIRQAILGGDVEIHTALSGEEALKKEEKEKYDLFITDLMMPGISGLDLLQTIKRKRPEAIVLMVTGYPTIKTAVQSVKMGAFDYIAKPFTPNELRSLVQRAIRLGESDKEKNEVTFQPKMPSDVFVIKGHTWIRKETQSLATVGVFFYFLKTIEKIDRIELIEENKNIYQGEVFSRIIDQDSHIHRIWSPATGRVVGINEKLKSEVSLIKVDPYDKGWLIKMESSDLEEDIKNLSVSPQQSSSQKKDA